MKLAVCLLALVACSGAAQGLAVRSERVPLAVDTRGLPRGYDAIVHSAVTGFDLDGRVYAITSRARIAVRRFSSPGCARLGQASYYGDVIEIDPACIVDSRMLAFVVRHELAHQAGGHHICRFPGELPDREDKGGCSPVGYGPALLNPVYYTLDPPPMQPTALDLAELRRRH